MILKYLSIRLNGPEASGHRMRIALHVTDTDERRVLELTNGVLISSPANRSVATDAALSLSRAQLGAISLGAVSFEESIDAGATVVSGDRELFSTLSSLLDTFPQNFPIVTP